MFGLVEYFWRRRRVRGGDVINSFKSFFWSVSIVGGRVIIVVCYFGIVYIVFRGDVCVVFFCSFLGV